MSAATPADWQIFECLGVIADPLGTMVHVKTSGQMLAMTMNQALYRIEEFTEPSQDIVLGMLPFIYSMPGYRVMYVTPLERHLIKNMRAMDKVYRDTMWEVIDDLAEDNRVDLKTPPSAGMEST